MKLQDLCQVHHTILFSVAATEVGLTSILLRIEGLKMYIPALILFETKTLGFSTKRWMRPVSSLYTTTPYLEGSSTLVTWAHECVCEGECLNEVMLGKAVKGRGIQGVMESTVEYVSSAHHVVSAHPPLQRQLPAKGTFIHVHVVSAHSNALQTYDAK